jgi:Circadian oscillating protein COP23
MKISLIISFILSGATVTSILLPIESIAQTPAKVSFYCGQTIDPNTNQIIPTTIVASSAKREPVALIQWRSKLSGKFTPQVRCNTVSAKFQQAWEAKRLNYLTAGLDKSSGLGIICGVKDLATPCDRSSMLFTLASGADANETIGRMNDFKRGKISDPDRQSAGTSIVDIESIVN